MLRVCVCVFAVVLLLPLLSPAQQASPRVILVDILVDDILQGACVCVCVCACVCVCV